MAEERKTPTAENTGVVGSAAMNDERLAAFAKGDERVAEVAKQARIVAEQKLAAYEYAHNYRKKLEKDKERRMTAAKLRREEERAAAAEREREEEERRISDALAEERLDAQRRNERVSDLLQKAKDAAEAQAPDDEVRDDAVSDTPAEKDESAAPENSIDENKEDIGSDAIDDADDGMEISFGDEEEPEDTEDEPIVNITHSDDEDYALDLGDLDDLCREVPDDDFITVDDADALAEKIIPEEPVEDTEKEAPVTKKKSAPAAAKQEEKPAPAVEPVAEAPTARPVAPAPAPVPKSEPEKKQAPVQNEEPEEIAEPETAVEEEPIEEPIEEPVEELETCEAPESCESAEVEPHVVEDDIVTLIKEEGKTVLDKSAFKKYLKRSNRAIKMFLSEIKKLEKELVATTDDARISEITVEIISRCASITEIRCDNVSVAARLDFKKDAQLLAEELYCDIERYNSKAAMFTALTGEQLTRISAFLPERLADRTGRAVIPKLAYSEKYIEVELDERGAPILADDGIATAIVSAPITASSTLGELYIGAEAKSSVYLKKAERTKKRLEAEAAVLERELRRNSAAWSENSSEERTATEKRENAIKSINLKYDNGASKRKKYTKKLDAINSKYEKAILKLRKEQKEGDYASTEKAITASLLAIEREKTIVDMLLVAGLHRTVKSKQLSAMKSEFVQQLRTYNASAERAALTLETPVTQHSSTLADEAAEKGKRKDLPKIARRRELIETVGENSRVIGDRIKSKDVGTIPARHTLINGNIFDKDKTLEERALLRENVMLDALRGASESVNGKRSYKKYCKLAKKTYKKLRRGLRQTKKAIFRALEKDGVVTSLVETLRIQSKIVELEKLNLTTALKRRVRTRKLEDRFYNAIAEYNNRALDYEHISGVKLIRNSLFLPEEMVSGEAKSDVATLSYKETYFEVYPKNNEGAKNDVAPAIRRPDAYIPVDYKYRRITENRTVEVTEIAPPVTAEERLDKMVADTRRELRRTTWQTMLAFMHLSRRLRKIVRRKKRIMRKSKRFDKRLAKLNKNYDTALFQLESLVPEQRREGPTYKEKLAKISDKYETKLAKLRYVRAQAAIERRIMKLSAEELSVRREKVAVFERRLSNVRAYGRPLPIRNAKFDLVQSIREYNSHAKEFSEIIGEPIVQVNPGIVEDIIRSGKVYKLPKMVMCREIIESYGDNKRIIGDRYRYGMPVVINAQGLAVMTGTNFLVPGMGSPHVGLRSDGQPIIGITDTGLPYAGAPDRTLTAKARINPTSAIKEPMLAYMNSEDLEDNEKVISSEMETAVSGEIDELDKFIGGAVKAKSMAVSNWREYRRYVRRSRRIRRALLKIAKENRAAIKKGIRYLAGLERNLNAVTESKKAVKIKTKLEAVVTEIETHESNKAKMLEELKSYRGASTKKERRAIENKLDVLEYMLEDCVKKYHSCKRDMDSIDAEGESVERAIERLESVLSGLYVRLLSVKGRIVELGSMDLYAASKIEISGIRRLFLAFSIVGANPKRKMYNRLFAAIDDYNDYILEDKDGRGFTAISVMLPDAIAERTDSETVPDLIFRERFMESDDVDGGAKITKMDLPTLRAGVPAGEPIASNSDFKLYEKAYARAVREIESKKRGIESEMRRLQDRLDDIRRRKLRAGTRYQRAIERISRKTRSVADYQRKMRRRLNRYRRRMYLLDKRERTPKISVKRWIKHYNGYNDKGLIYGLAGRIRKDSVVMLSLERERLMLAAGMLSDAIKSTSRHARDFRAEAKRQLVMAMVKYNRAAEECSNRINEPISKVNTDLPSMIIKLGEVPEIPEVVCATALCEAVGEGRREVV